MYSGTIYYFLTMCLVSLIGIQETCGGMMQNVRQHKEKWATARANCQNSTQDNSLKSRNLQGIIQLAQTGGENALCYFYCLLTELNVITNDNKLNTENAETVMEGINDNNVKSRISSLVQSCSSAVNENTSTERCAIAQIIIDCTSNAVKQIPGSMLLFLSNIFN
ncbi:uncharacterized protein LOC123292733 [Chrysoperla carnea]|uniref:uncharacterized protein LOC123292733 n=1 Tax=Chrysoperla carnea TaxID=189513 RepID=UPI001D0905F9|nr:uncharacterized protein LOC123292733 [Chrysoperla carnea]